MSADQSTICPGIEEAGFQSPRTDVSSYERVTGRMDVLSQAVFERYQCPVEFLDFALSGELSEDPDFFHFGPNVVCYGRSCVRADQSQPARTQPDLLGEIVANSEVKLPFDPTEIIDNLRLERYANDRSGLQEVLRKLYYRARPLMPASLRRRIQQFRARTWSKRTFPHWPVDTTVENLCEKLMMLSLEAKGVERIPFVWFWPSGADACITMTHDVETETGRDFCSELMDLDEAFGLKASFQIVPEERYTIPMDLLESMRQRGFEVGIQDLNHDGRLYDSKKKFLERVETINRYAREYGARGFRAGVLYRKPEWYDALEFSFDMSIPNVAHLDPQQGGCCTVMPYFIGHILEIPVTTTQDYMLFHILGDRSIDLWKSQLDLILGKHGVASFVVHPDYIVDRGNRRIYEDLLGYLVALRSRKDVWFALPREIDRWWRLRSQLRIEKHGNCWRIEGDGADSAVLAYATKNNGRLVYELPTGTVV